MSTEDLTTAAAAIATETQGQAGDNSQAELENQGAANPSPETGAQEEGSANDPGADATGGDSGASRDDAYFLRLAAKAEIDPNLEISPEDQAALDNWIAEGNSFDMEQFQELVDKLKNGEDLDETTDQSTEEKQEDPKGEVSAEIAKAMEIVGAKDVNELASKIMDLKKNRDEVGSKLGNEKKALETQLQAQERFIQDFFAGKPEAIQYARTHGMPIPEWVEEMVEENREFGTQAEESNDPRLAELQAQLQQKEHELAAINAERQAFSMLENVLDDFAEDYMPQGLTKSQTIELYKSYLKDDPNNPADPRIQPLVDLVNFAAESKAGSLQIAAQALGYNKIKGKLGDVAKTAAQKAREELLNKPRTTGLAGKRDAAENNLGIADLQKMEDGAMPTPAGWLDDRGMPTNKMPDYARKFFLRNQS